MTIFLPMIPQVVPEWHALNFSRFYSHWFIVLLLVFVAGQLMTRKKFLLTELILMLFAAFETILHAQFMLLFVPVCARLLAVVLAEWVDRLRLGREHRALNAAVVAEALGVIVGFFSSRKSRSRTVNNSGSHVRLA